MVIYCFVGLDFQGRYADPHVVFVSCTRSSWYDSWTKPNEEDPGRCTSTVDLGGESNSGQGSIALPLSVI
jgi:hypothetical protein